MEIRAPTKCSGDVEGSHSPHQEQTAWFCALARHTTGCVSISFIAGLSYSSVASQAQRARAVLKNKSDPALRRAWEQKQRADYVCLDTYLDHTRAEDLKKSTEHRKALRGRLTWVSFGSHFAHACSSTSLRKCPTMTSTAAPTRTGPGCVLPGSFGCIMMLYVVAVDAYR